MPSPIKPTALRSIVAMLSVPLVLGCSRHHEAQAEAVKPSQAGLVFDPAVIDVGSIGVNEERPFLTRLENEFNSPVEIVKVAPSCGCTKVDVGSRRLESGTATELAGVFRAPDGVGRMNRRITITTSNGLEFEI